MKWAKDPFFGSQIAVNLLLGCGYFFPNRQNNKSRVKFAFGNVC